MRKLIFAISIMALPLAACGQTEETPSEPETPPVVEEPVVEELVTGSDDAPSDTDGTKTDGSDKSAMKPGMDEPQGKPAVPADDKGAKE